MSEIFPYSQISQSYLKNLGPDGYNDFIFNVHIDGKSDILKTLLITDKHKRRYLAVLDQCLAKRLKGKAYISFAEIQFCQKIGTEELQRLIVAEAKKLGGEHLISHNTRVYCLQVVEKFIQLFLSNRSDFEKQAKTKLLEPRNPYSYKNDIIKVIAIHDPQYAYCWAMLLNLRYKQLPVGLRTECKKYQLDAQKFIKEMTGEETVGLPRTRKGKLLNINDPLPNLTSPTQSYPEVLNVLGKKYKLITVQSKKKFSKFLSGGFLKVKSCKTLGIDCETDSNNNLKLLQVATSEWCCIFDVHVLLDKPLQPMWKQLFQIIFHPKIVRVGFAFESDFMYIAKAFPELKQFLLEKNVLCLQKLIHSINTTFVDVANEVFLLGKPATISLSNVAKSVLGISTEKELQQSDWAKRPLTEDQIIYAATDAIAVILIKEKVESVLKRKLGDGKASEIMKEAMVSIKN
jgi:hypothetical protein